MHPFLDLFPNDARLASLIGFESLRAPELDCNALSPAPGMTRHIVSAPSAGRMFLHEAAIIEYRGTLFASWYCCPQSELSGVTPIYESRSHDWGKTWDEPRIIGVDPRGDVLYCPPVYGISDDTLYLLLNTMWKKGDHMHSLDLYRYDNDKGEYDHLWSRPIPFKLNTNVYRLANGKLLLPGRMAEFDGFPDTPGVLISDSGKIDAAWRPVLFQRDGFLPDGSRHVHPEISAVVNGHTVYIFCRHPGIPLMYRSDDDGEHWSKPYSFDIPFGGSKIYSGALADGRNFVIGNLHPGRLGHNERDRLALFIAPKGSMRFNRGYMIREGAAPEMEKFPWWRECGPEPHYPWWHYPSAVESNGALYVIYTMQPHHGNNGARGAELAVIPLAGL